MKLPLGEVRMDDGSAWGDKYGLTGTGYASHIFGVALAAMLDLVRKKQPEIFFQPWKRAGPGYSISWLDKWVRSSGSGTTYA